MRVSLRAFILNKISSLSRGKMLFFSYSSRQKCAVLDTKYRKLEDIMESLLLLSKTKLET